MLHDTLHTGKGLAMGCPTVPGETRAATTLWKVFSVFVEQLALTLDLTQVSFDWRHGGFVCSLTKLDD